MIEDIQTSGRSTSLQGGEAREVRDIEEAIERMGGFGRYQRLAQVIVTLGFAMGSFSLYPMGFYELMPDFECSHFDPVLDIWTTWKKCENTDFCENLREGADGPVEYVDSRFGKYEKHRHRVDNSSKTSLKNWVDKYDLQCAPKQ